MEETLYFSSPKIELSKLAVNRCRSWLSHVALLGSTRVGVGACGREAWVGEKTVRQSERGSSSWGGGEDGVVDECHPGIRCVPGRCGPPTCSCDRAPLFFRPGSERPAVNVPAPLPGQHRLVWGGPQTCKYSKLGW